MTMPRFARLLLALAPLLAGCTSWERTQEFEGWTLYVQSGERVEVQEFHDAVQPAFEAVERELGPFERNVRIHAWNGGVEVRDGNRGVIHGESSGTVEDIEDIGPARVTAFHARSDGGPFSVSGVFVGSADTGTTVHELVHAYFAERGEDLPLWFEEGFAMILGDGALYEGEWHYDGLACWPWRKLREQEFSDDEIAHLLEVTARDDHSSRDNVLVHFIGWAIVFDLYRELGVLDWELMLAHFNSAPDPVREARRRLERTIDDETPLAWLERLEDPRPATRFAAARGTWKLHSPEVLVLLTRAVRTEEDPEVRASMAVNVIATAGKTRLGRRREYWMWRTLRPVLRDTELDIPEETSALRTLYRAYRYGSRRYDTQAALARLDRFWEE